MSRFGHGNQKEVIWVILHEDAHRADAEGLAAELEYRPPFHWDALLDFLAGRAIGGVEQVVDASYARTARIRRPNGEEVTGWLRVWHRPENHALVVYLSPALLPVSEQVLARVRRLFDLDCAPLVIAEALQPMNELRPGSFVPGIRVPGCFDEFELVCRAVLGQQVSVKSASTLATRITQHFGSPIDTGVAGLTHSFPAPTQVLQLADDIEDQFGRLGVVSARSRTILALAAALHLGEIDLSHSPDPAREMQKLLGIRGIGPWTANYIAMRAMAWPDAFLETDAAIKKALAPRTPRQSLHLAEAWRPWRSYATFALWNSLPAISQ
ncbi:MAG: AlkA N-terminal domain-containing protein [Brooklawnia sp.]|jgi:AraC family transcriptional regulator of adaptative response / DNA-3-methyladenine glycosylase II